MLLCSPNYLSQTSLPLCVPGEPESQSLAFSKQTTLWASPANAGAMELANEIAATFPNLTVFTAEAPGPATRMLLYLSDDALVRILLNLTRRGLCSARRASRQLNSLVATEGFCTAWVAEQKTM